MHGHKKEEVIYAFVGWILFGQQKKRGRNSPHHNFFEEGPFSSYQSIKSVAQNDSPPTL